MYNEILQKSDMLYIYIYTSFYRQASSRLLQFGLIPLEVAFQMSSIFGEATFTSKTDPDHFEIILAVWAQIRLNKMSDSLNPDHIMTVLLLIK